MQNGMKCTRRCAKALENRLCIRKIAHPLLILLKKFSKNICIRTSHVSCLFKIAVCLLGVCIVHLASYKLCGWSFRGLWRMELGVRAKL